jgi:Fur family ferric uptake transcriptional regulator
MTSSAFLLPTEKKLRSTVYRRALLTLFEQEASFSVPALLEALAQAKLTPNKTTLYREIETLLAEGLIEQVPVASGSAQIYKGVTKQGHYHHVVCTNCSKVIDVEVPAVESALYQAEQELGKKAQFSITGHTLTFSGTCNGCSQTAK